MSRTKFNGFVKSFIVTRVGQNFQDEILLSALADSYSFGKWNAEKCKFFKNRTTFRYAYRPSKFCYYHTYVEWGYKQKLIFFKFFKEKLFFFLFYLNSKWKMCSFEVHYVDVAQKLRKLEGGYNSDCSLWTAPPNLLIFELHQHYVPQKNTFFM